jgi:hypothetical protein
VEETCKIYYDEEEDLLNVVKTEADTDGTCKVYYLKESEVITMLIAG